MHLIAVQCVVFQILFEHSLFCNCRIVDEELRDYFPLPNVVSGIFKLVSNLFGVKVEEVTKEVKAWSPEVKLFRVVDGQKELGHFFFDPYLRCGDFYKF